MNKYIEALDFAKKHLDSKHDLERVRVLQELVDKATPKKPLPNKKIEKGKYITWNCPNCNKYISSGYYYPPLRMAYNHKYCCECGQKLDWSDEK